MVLMEIWGLKSTSREVVTAAEEEPLNLTAKHPPNRLLTPETSKDASDFASWQTTSAETDLFDIAQYKQIESSLPYIEHP
jgi:hypothetical protein